MKKQRVKQWEEELEPVDIEMVEEDGEESYTSDCCLQFECGREGGGEGDRVDKLNEGVTVHKYCLDALGISF